MHSSAVPGRTFPVAFRSEAEIPIIGAAERGQSLTALMATSSSPIDSQAILHYIGTNVSNQKRFSNTGQAQRGKMEKIINIHIEKLFEGVYLATSDDVQGLVAQGRTATEALEIARDVARKLIEARA